jgi:hypothetical protein
LTYIDLLKDLLPKELSEKSHTSPPAFNNLAWYYSDVKKVLVVLRDKNQIILGGEVLLKKEDKLEVTWDYWDYDIDGNISHQENVEKSFQNAIKYIDWLCKNKFDNYLFSIDINIHTDRPLAQKD